MLAFIEFSFDQPPLSTFWPASAAALLGLLGLLLVEARGIADQLAEKRRGALQHGHVRRMPVRFMVPVLLTVCVGDAMAFYVLWRGDAELWHAVIVWISLAVGLLSMLLAGVVMLIEVKGWRWGPAMRGVRRWAPLALGAITGLIVAAVASGTNIGGARFAVYGTCLSGGCGLKQRAGPGSDFPEVDPRDRIVDGTLVLVVCQTSGLPPRRVRSRVWDRLPNGRYVSDAFINTPNRAGGFSEGLPRC
jgi:hypothetical protein